MKKIISFFMLIVLTSCFMGHSASAAPCFNQETDFIQATLSSLDKPSNFELLSLAIVETEGDFTCVETVYKEKSFAPILNTAGGNAAGIDICHTWFRSGTIICSLELSFSFTWTGTSAVARPQNLNPCFEQYEAYSGYALGNITTHNSNSANDKASIVQPYTVSDKYGNTSTSSFRAYCTVTGVCTGNNNESHNF